MKVRKAAAGESGHCTIGPMTHKTPRLTGQLVAADVEPRKSRDVAELLGNNA